MSEFMDFDVLSGNEFLAKELKAYSSNPDLLFFTSFGLDDMRARSQPVAGFIVPYKCYELRKLEKLDRNRMRIRKGGLRLSPNEEAQIVREETEKRRRLRIQQVREQSKENAAKIRHAVKQEKHKQLMRLATDIKDQLEAEKAERVRHLEQQYDNSLRNIGVGHKSAGQQPDYAEEKALVQQEENLRAEARGRAAAEHHRQEAAQRNFEAQKHVIARQEALAIEKARASQIAAMPAPPPDPVANVILPKPKPVKVTDMHTFSTSHYHLQNEHAVDRAEPNEQQSSAREAAEMEQERIRERALELKRLRQDQLERARLRHNAALEKELLKHDYDNILHDLSDLQRSDRERRLKIVHNIPKQVFEPPHIRMEDREERQRNLEEQFEDMYMAGTRRLGDVSMALESGPLIPSQENSLDVTGQDGMGNGETRTPIREPTLPGMPSVLQDMTNVPKQRKQPEKVLRSLMDRIKSQREEWVNTRALGEVGESPVYPTLNQAGDNQSPAINGDGDFHPLLPEESPEKQRRVHSPVATDNGGSRKIAPSKGEQTRERITAMRPDGFSDTLWATNQRQQTNVQFYPEPTQMPSMPSQLQQIEYAEICKQQEIILEQKRQLELQLQKLTYEQQKLQLANQAGTQQTPPPPSSYAVSAPGSVAMTMPTLSSAAMQMPAPGSYATSMPTTAPVSMAAPVSETRMPTAPAFEPQTSQPYVQTFQPWQGAQPIGFESLQNGHMPVSGYFPMMSMPQPHSFPQQASQFQGHHGVAMQPGLHQNLNGSLSSSGMSQNPMHSIPPTATTGSAPINTSQGQGVNSYLGQGQIRSAYQPPSAVLTTDQLATSSSQMYPVSAQNGYHYGAPVATTTSSFAPVSTATSLQGHTAVSPGHIPPSSLTNAGMSEQMRKVKEYQEYLLARHEQSKKVLDETKAEIKRRRDNLLERYPNLDLTRLEGLGAKYLENGDIPQQTSVAHTKGQTGKDPAVPVPVPRGFGQGQGQTSVASLLASLAAHPYYAATLSQPDHDTSGRPSSMMTATVGTVQIKGGIPAGLDLNSETNLRKNKFESIRKSLPFEGDESLVQNESFPDRVYDAYTQRNLDMTDTTDSTESDVSSLTEKGSPALKLAPKPAPRNTEASRKRSHDKAERSSATTEESDINTSTSFTSGSEGDVSMLRQDELHKQLEDIQRQKEEIIRRHQQGQQSLRSKEEDLKAKLASLAPEELARQLRDTAKQQQLQDMYPTNLRQPFNLSTIMEVETPSSSARPSDGHSSDPNDLSQYSMQSQKSQRSLDYSQSKSSERIPEEPDMENVHTQMEALRKGKSEHVADYSGRNIEDVLERAKRFESEVLEKLRKQTNAVLFDNGFDDSLEFSVSKKETSNQSLSTGTLTDDSLSTGPLDETSLSRQTDTKSANGSFQNSKSWAAELSQFKIPASDQSELPFKVIPSKVPQASTDDQNTMFTTNRFKIYSAINQSGSGASLSESSLMDESGSMNANDMMVHLKTLQDQIRRSEEERVMLTRKLAEQQKNSENQSKSLSQYSGESSHEVSRPFMNGPSKNDGNKSDLSQYSLTDKSADVSFSGNYQSETSKDRFESPVQSGTTCRELPVRRSPIGHTATEAPKVLTNQRGVQDQTGTEFSFMMSSSKQQRSTSTPGDDRRKSAMNGTNRSELPSEITVGDKTDGSSVNPQSRNFDTNSATGSRSFHMIGEDSFSNRRSFETMLPDGHDNSANGELSQHSLSAEENIREIKKEFDRLDKASQKIKTFAVSKDGELISENSDSDKSHSVEHLQETDLTNYTLSTQDNTDKFTKSEDFQSKLSVYTLPESSAESRLSQVSDFSHKSSGKSDSWGSNPKSSSFTTVTSDTSLNGTGLSTLSQYTLGDSKAGDTQKPGVENENYMQEKFASLDNLISESKNLIARHKQIIDKGKSLEEVKPKFPVSAPPPLPKQPAPWESLGKPLTGGESGSKQIQNKETTLPTIKESKPEKKTSSAPTKFDLHGPKPFYKSAKSAEESSRSLSMYTSQAGSISTPETSKNQSNNVDVNSLEYLVENSAGITDETIPDLSTMTLGSELSITEAFSKTGDMNESSDSLNSFEKHEMSEAESSHNYDDDGLRVDSSRADNLQQIIEARKHNFMVQSERRAAAAKERALGQRVSKDNDHQLFRAVPVSIVAEPTLSMAVSSSKAERGRSPTKSPRREKPAGSSDRKSILEAKEKEEKDHKLATTATAATSVSSKSLNRALQPRGSESPRPKDSGTDPSESGSRAKDHGKFGFGSSSKLSLRESSPSPNSSSEERAHHGRLFGEIQQFGGSAGLAARQSPSPSPPTARKTPPKVMPKPVRKKSDEAPPVSKPISQSSAGASGLSKTLSSWKKSRAVSAPPVSRLLDSSQQHETLKNSIKVLPEEAPVPLTEEERRKKAEDELYEKNIRLQHKLDTTDEQDTSNNSVTSSSDRTRDSKKESPDNLRKQRR
ncbi:uncharacterized protein LOC127836082 isoform X3 [Dreissena polymorpha]|uniref:uncharacterized protein LOC127836082 isoform X3 n=1 Tax=Dreissena polymorpha TaxID=45954 RepID=UPI002265055C|nr:uncharacterized protein LOC127836082 isoform X3 [Dreissena polymorpha]